MRRLLLTILLWMLLGLLAACKLPLDERPEVQQLRAKNASLEQRLQTLENEQQALRKDVRNLQLQLAGVRDLAMKNSHQLQEAAAKHRKIQAEVKKAAVRKQARAKKKPKGNREAVLTYNEALEYYKNGRFEKSIDLLHAFIKAYPRHELAGNARYWLGENYYSLAEFAQAITEFKRLLKEYPQSKKVPDSLVKIGMAYEAIGIDEKARKFYQQVIDKYPQSSGAALARKRIAGGKNS